MLSTFNLILLISGITVVIAVLLYFAGSARTIRIPSVILGTIGGVGLGVLLGFVLAAVYEGELNLEEDNSAQEALVNVMPQPATGAGGPATKGGGMMGGGGGGGMGGGGRGPNPKTQLVTLVTKLDQLTAKPLAVTLDDDQKAKVEEQLKELETMDALSTDEAKKRLDTLHAIIENQRETLEAAGYRWPGGGGGPGPRVTGVTESDNPFTGEANASRLKALHERLQPAVSTATP